MRKQMITAGVLTLLLTANISADGEDVPLPKDYATTFTNYVSSDRIQNPDQTIRLFANDIAMQGPGDDGKLPYGSILVAEVYKARVDENDVVMKSSLGRRIRGKFALIAVMAREKGLGDNVPQELKNGDWGFSAYKPDGSVADKDLNECRACHAPLGDTNFLFSFDHLKPSS